MAFMTRYFASYDGTRLAYQVRDLGSPLHCACPAARVRNPEYFGDLGGVGRLADRELVLLELRGTGASAVPADPATYRCDRMTGDVEALRIHLGLDQIDLLGHSAGWRPRAAVRRALPGPDRPPDPPEPGSALGRSRGHRRRTAREHGGAVRRAVVLRREGRRRGGVRRRGSPRRTAAGCCRSSTAAGTRRPRRTRRGRATGARRHRRVLRGRARSIRRRPGRCSPGFLPRSWC